MNDNNQNLVEIAKTKRHMALIEKLQKTSLSSKEVRELEEFEKGTKPNEQGIIDGTVNMAAICVYLEKSPRMIRRYVSQGMPVIRDSKGEIFRFKVAEVFRWFYGGRDYDKDEKSQWDIEYKKNRAKLSNIELKEKERELIPHVEHVSILKNQIRGIKAGFLRLPKYIAPRLYQQEPKVICEMLDNELRYIIGQFSGSLYASQSSEKDS